MPNGKTITRIILATVVGEIALVALTTVAQEVLFNGINYYTSPFSDILLGGLATFFASVLAGGIASLIVRGRSYWPHVFISVIIIAEMTYLMTTGALTSPIWFDTLSGFSLIVGIWLGHYCYRSYSSVPAKF
jgi:hypothetical protein